MKWNQMTMGAAALVMSVSLASAQGPGRMGQGMGAGMGAGMGQGIGGAHMGAGGGAMLGAMHQATVAGAPYSGVATTQTQRSLDGGNQIAHSNQSKVYRDGQGRVRVEHKNAQGVNVVTILDPVAGYMYRLDTAKQVAVKMSLPPGVKNGTGMGLGQGMGTGPRHANANATVNTEDLGQQTVNGVAAKGTRTTTTIPAGAIGNAAALQSVREVWVSVDLKVPVSIKTTDPRFGSSSMQLTSIAQAEPDPTLFQVPATYTVREQTAGMGRGAGRGAAMMRRNR